MENTATPSHIHPAVGTDRSFVIDPKTKEICASTSNLVLAQRSNKSDRFVFTIPATNIDGHDMTACNSVMIHFENISQDLTQRSIGIYKVTDLTEEDGPVTLSWLIGEEATLHAGSLIFSIHFSCTAEDGTVDYNFPTLTFARVTIGATVWNSDTIVKEHPDIIAEFDSRIAALTRACSASVRFDGPQDLTPEEQAQAQENLGVKGYYSTTREELSVTLGKENAVPNDVTSAAVWSLYDALMAKHPDRVQKNEFHNNDGTFTNYEYVISTGEYNTEGEFAERYGDKDIKKPKYLILSGIHGYEEPAILSVYRFVRDVLEGHNIPAQFREGCILHILPVGNPYSLDNHIRYNESGVDINRNFDWNWSDEVEEGKNPGPSAVSEKETQAIANWLIANNDAAIFFDCHNQGAVVNEVAWIIGLDNNRAKKIALQGVGRVVPFWRDVIGYADGTVYPISMSLDNSGLAINYAYEVLHIPSLALEMSALQNGVKPDDYTAYDDLITPETVSAGAEVIGNVLIEFYEQMFSGEVVDMTETNEKIDELAVSMDVLLNQVNSGFRVETGVYTVAADVTSEAVVELPCKGVKILVFVSDTNTREEILKTTSGMWMIGFVGQTLAELPYILETYIRCGGYLSRINDGKLENSAGVIVDTDNGVKFAANGLKAGTYNWTAYYWNE